MKKIYTKRKYINKEIYILKKYIHQEDIHRKQIYRQRKYPYKKTKNIEGYIQKPEENRKFKCHIYILQTTVYDFENLKKNFL